MYIKNILAAVLLVAVFSGCSPNKQRENDYETKLNEYYNQEFTKYAIIAPPGTLNSEIEAIFGEPITTMQIKNAIPEGSEILKTYELLSKDEANGMQVTIMFDFQNDRTITMPIPDETLLNHLDKVHEKWDGKLKEAAWNQK